MVGGSPADVDAARTALRLGSIEVSIIYKGTKEELAALPREIDAATEEGVRMEFLTWPTAVVINNDKVTGLSCGDHVLRKVLERGPETVDSLARIVSDVSEERLKESVAREIINGEMARIYLIACSTGVEVEGCRQQKLP